MRTTPDINKILRANPRPGKYGAPMGMSNQFDPDSAAPLYCQRVRFIDGDYSADGTYWGGGRGTLPLWAVFNAECTTLCFYRAATRKAALLQFDAEHGDDRRAALKEAQSCKAP